jgi:hypothetical protein
MFCSFTNNFEYDVLKNTHTHTVNTCWNENPFGDTGHLENHTRRTKNYETSFYGKGGARGQYFGFSTMRRELYGTTPSTQVLNGRTTVVPY